MSIRPCVSRLPTHNPILTYTHLYSPILTYTHLYSPILTYTHLYSPILTVTGHHGEQSRNDRPRSACKLGSMENSEQLWNVFVVPVEGIEPPCLAAHDFESCASTSSATRA
jgi:hypothetical protein